MPEPNCLAPPQPLTRAAFTTLVERSQGDLHRFLYGLLGHPEQTRDLLQDTFYDAWRAVQRGAAPLVMGGAPEEMRRWLFHVAHDRAMMALRRRRLISWVSLDERVAVEDAALPSRASFEDQIAEHAALDVALAALRPKDVSCLLLIVVQGFTAAETAQMLGDSPQAVAKRFSRAKRRLLDAYRAQAEAPQEPPRR